MMQEEKYPKDKGCFLHPTCLECPEPICIFDFEGGIKAFLKDKETKRLISEGASSKDIARQLGIDQSTARRRIKRTKVGVA